MTAPAADDWDSLTPGSPEAQEVVRRRLKTAKADERPEPEHGPGYRRVHLTAASTIKVKPVHWLWRDRIAVGTMALIAGREGIGKSTVGYDIAAQVTNGTLPGAYQGQPRSVIVAASEDSWEHTIVPRLMAAGADLSRVFRVDVVTSLGSDGFLNLPTDTDGLEQAIADEDVALVLLDPLISRLSAGLDTHKDAEVRRALEPLTAMANRCGVALIGLIHLNKSGSADPLDLLMGSRAFPAVARSVLFVMRDPDDDELRLLGEPKNNLGRSDLPTLTFRIVGKKVADTDEGEVWTGAVDWIGESDRSVHEALEQGGPASGGGESRTAAGEAAGWLEDYLTQQGGSAPSKDVKRAGKAEGHSESALGRARSLLKITSTSEGFPRRSYWSLPGTQPQSSQVSPGESELTELTELTGTTETQSVQSRQSFQSTQASPAADATDDADLVLPLDATPSAGVPS